MPLARIIHPPCLTMPRSAFAIQPYPAGKSQLAFDGGRLSSGRGVMLLSLAERRRAIAGGNDLDWLRFDPAFKLTCGRLPDTGDDLCSRPAILATRA